MNEWLSMPLPEGTGVWLAIAAMALATYLCRVGGFWLIAVVPLTPRLKRALEALPGAIVAATVAPLVLKGGLVAGLAVGAGLAMMIWRRNELLSLVTGLVVAAALRAAGL
jgi:uncharacterized membrane protein